MADFAPNQPRPASWKLRFDTKGGNWMIPHPERPHTGKSKIRAEIEVGKPKFRELVRTKILLPPDEAHPLPAHLEWQTNKKGSGINVTFPPGTIKGEARKTSMRIGAYTSAASKKFMQSESFTSQHLFDRARIERAFELPRSQAPASKAPASTSKQWGVPEEKQTRPFQGNYDSILQGSHSLEIDQHDIDRLYQGPSSTPILHSPKASGQPVKKKQKPAPAQPETQFAPLDFDNLQGVDAVNFDVDFDFDF